MNKKEFIKSQFAGFTDPAVAEMDYEKDISIDEEALDIEWLEQPRLMMQYSKHLAQARMELDELKQALEITKAEIDRKIRATPEKYKLEKITDKSIESITITSSEYKQAFQEYLDAKYEADMAMSAVRAFEQRKEALENLVRLHGQQYFAGPKVPRDISWEREEKQKKVQSGIASKMKRKN